MSEVKRWTHAVKWEGLQISASYMAINDGGEYVMHSDYATLEAERDELRQQLANVFKGNTKLHVLWTEAAQQRDKLREECDSFQRVGIRAMEERDAALAECERLKEALREIEWSNDSTWQSDRAKEALSAKP